LTEARISERDLLTVVVLSIVFFSVATWNLGMTQTPVSTWKTTENKSFYIDMGGFKSTGNVYFLVKSGNATVEVYAGSPGNWSYITAVAIEGYYSWSQIGINKDTRYIRFDFQPQPSSFPPPPYIEVAEMAILGQNNERIAINTIATEGAIDKDLPKLIDEQSLVQCPPTYMSETYFDEIYFVRTAESYLKLQQPYEWTHPPFGKLIIASGILVFGYSPFGWRIMGVVFATLMITLIYVLGKELFGTWIGAFASAFLLTFDFMVFTMGRMGTADTYVVFFSLASQLFFLIYVKNVLRNGWKTSVLPLLLAVLFFTLGFSTKWLVLYGFLGQLAILLALRLKDIIKLKNGLSAKISAFFNRPFFQLYYFLLLAILIYFLTYIPDMLAGRSLLDVLQLQGSMYIYHSTLTATHPFASPWFSWPFMWSPFGQHVPLWLYVSYLPANTVSTIVLMGNPAVWWVGFAFLLLTVEEAVRSKSFVCIFITVLFFFQWLPYVFISRITFIYHFYVNVPILCLATAYFLDKYWSKRWGKATAIAYFAVVVVLFWLFYPAISGAPAPSSSIDSLRWLKSWVF
jgi:dolichyl-phosphate-mannose-protein mannosyltransferase